MVAKLNKTPKNIVYSYEEAPNACHQLIAEAEERAYRYAEELMAQHTAEVTLHGYLIFITTVIGLIGISALLAWLL